MKLLKRLIHKWLFTYDFHVKLLDGGKEQPVRAYPNDAGYDLYVSRSTLVPAHGTVNVPTGVAIKNNDVTAWILLTGRSSTLHKHGIIVNEAVIDDGYTGEMCMVAYNTTKKDIRLHPDMRIGQIIILPHTNCNFKYVDKFIVKKGERGLSGFGSTGK